MIEYAKGIDMFVSLSTVYSLQKTLCYTMLPCVSDQLRKVEEKCMTG